MAANAPTMCMTFCAPSNTLPDLSMSGNGSQHKGADHMTDSISARLRENYRLRGSIVYPLSNEAANQIDAQDAKIKALVEAGAAVVRDAIRQDLHGNGALNDVVMPYLIDELSAAIAATKETT